MPSYAKRFVSLLMALLFIGIIPGSMNMVEAQNNPPAPNTPGVVTTEHADAKRAARADLDVSSRLLALTTVSTRDEMMNMATQAGLQLTARGVKTTVIAHSEADASRLMDELLTVGATDIQRYSRWIDATIPVSSLEAAGRLSGISLIQPVIEAFPLQQEPITIGGNDVTTVSDNQEQVGQPATTNSTTPNTSTFSLPNSGPVVNTGTYTSAGVAASNADAWHTAGITGDGIVVGVLDTFAYLDQTQAAGDLPPDARITELGTLDTSGTHGVSVAEIIYDMAPDVDFIFSSPTSAVEMANQITQMAQSGADVISSSVGFFNAEPGDGTGPVSDAITNVTNTYDVLVVQAAGNQALHNWQGVFDDSNNDNGYHEFPNGDEINRFYVESGTFISIYLRWNSWPVTNQDYDILLFREDPSLPGGRESVGVGGVNFQDGDDPPIEHVTHTATQNGYYSWLISQYIGDGNPEFLDVMGYRTPNFEKNILSYSLVDPATSAAVTGVAAVDVNSNNRESYSSAGPSLGLGGDLSSRGNSQPRLAGYTNVDTYASLQNFGQQFRGTSAATPHVSGAAALIRSAFPSYDVNDVKNFLESRAIDEGPGGYDTYYGAGRLHLGTPPAQNLVTNGTFDNGRTGWNLFGDFGFQWQNGSMNIWREFPGWRGAVMFQQVNQSLTAGAPLRLEMELSNTGAVPKGAEIIMRNASFSNIISCAVTIEPGQMNVPVSVQHETNQPWSEIIALIRLNDPDGEEGLLVDNVRLTSDSNQPAGYDCTGLPTPENQELVSNGQLTSNRLYWTLWGRYGFQYANSQINVYRNAGSSMMAGVLNYPSYHLDPGSRFSVLMQLGNSSNSDKDVQLVVRDDRWTEFLVCDYTVPANSPKQFVEVRGETTTEWSKVAIILRILADDDAEWLIVDDARMEVDNTLDVSTQCSGAYTTTATGSNGAVDTGDALNNTDTKPLPDVMPVVGSEPPAIPEGGSSAPANDSGNSDGMPTIPGF